VPGRGPQEVAPPGRARTLHLREAQRSTESKSSVSPLNALWLPAWTNICRLPKHGAASCRLWRERYRCCGLYALLMGQDIFKIGAKTDARALVGKLRDQVLIITASPSALRAECGSGRRSTA
jgi:hypothetical protein